MGPQESLLATVKRRKPAWFGHVTCQDSLSKTILQGTLEGGRLRGRQRKCWMENIKEWTLLPMPELLTRASCRKDLKGISAESSLMSPRRHNWSRDWTELDCACALLGGCLAVQTGRNCACALLPHFLHLSPSNAISDAVVGRGNGEWSTSKSGHPCQCQNCSRWPSAEKTGRGSLLNCLSCPPNDPTGQGTELN